MPAADAVLFVVVHDHFSFARPDWLRRRLGAAELYSRSLRLWASQIDQRRAGIEIFLTYAPDLSSDAESRMPRADQMF